MSMDPCEEFRMHAAKDVVGSRYFARMSQVLGLNFDNPESGRLFGK